MKRIVLIISIAVFVNTSWAQSKKSPSFEEVISLSSASSAMISPDGNHIVFTSQTADWEENRYDTELWLSKDGQLHFS